MAENEDYGALKNYEVIKFLAKSGKTVEISDVADHFKVCYSTAHSRIESLTRLKLLKQIKKGRGNTHISLWELTEKGRGYALP